MNEHQQFLKATLKNPLGVGAVVPSSKHLAKLMVKDLEPTKDSMILELGVGTGAITAAIDEILPDTESYLGVELDTELAVMVQKKFPELKIVNADACSCQELHSRQDLGNVRFILSGIPFVSLPKETCDNILKEIDFFMEKGCLFRTFQYVHGFYTPPAKRLREYMTDRYGPMQKSSVVLKNVPPAFTLTWQTV